MQSIEKIIVDKNGPDRNAGGFLEEAVNSLRYENSSNDPDNVAAKISKHIDRGCKVLDVGCGTGSITDVIINLSGANLIGVEPDVERVQVAKNRGLKVYSGLLRKEIFDIEGPFDAIVFADVIEHLPNPADVIAVAKSGLAPQGLIIASVPNVAHWFVRLDLLRGRFDYKDCGIMDATHLRWFTRKTIVEFFERSGFSVEDIDVTVNIDLPDYSLRFPWKYLKGSFRLRVVRFLVKKFPSLFGCQYVVKARLK